MPATPVILRDAVLAMLGGTGKKKQLLFDLLMLEFQEIDGEGCGLKIVDLFHLSLGERCNDGREMGHNGLEGKGLIG